MRPGDVDEVVNTRGQVAFVNTAGHRRNGYVVALLGDIFGWASYITMRGWAADGLGEVERPTFRRPRRGMTMLAERGLRPR